MEPTRATKYHYESLSQENEIRVLVLQPGRAADPLQCHLMRVSLDDPPQYEALSYVWGDASKKDEILCDNGTLAITTNLHTALRYIREKETERIIWADAICETISCSSSRTVLMSGRHQPG